DEDELYSALDWLPGRPAAGGAAAPARAPPARPALALDGASQLAEGRPAAANSPGSATIATAREASCRLSTGCCARPTAARSPSRCLRVIPPTRCSSPPTSRSTMQGL